MCYGCVMNVLWECYESVMKVSWKRYESVMKVLWMCYGCVMDVWGMLWISEGCYGCVKDVCIMDEWWIFYITVMLIFVFCFSWFFKWPIKIWPHDGVCVLLRTHRTRTNGAQWVWSWCRVSAGSSANRLQTSDVMQWSVSGPPGGAKNSTQQTAVTARRRETCSVLDQVFWNIWTLIILVYIQLNVLLLEMWLIFCGNLWYSIGTSQRFLYRDYKNIYVIVINEFYGHRVISHYQQK